MNFRDPTPYVFAAGFAVGLVCGFLLAAAIASLWTA